MRFSRSAFATFFVVQGTAAILGVLLYLALAAPPTTAGNSVPTASAANHCTRFAPPTAVDTNCGVLSSQATGANPDFMTNSFALRTDIYLLFNRTYMWGLSYVGEGGTSGNSSAGYYWPDSTGYVKSRCSFFNLEPVGLQWHCTTDWHD